MPFLGVNKKGRIGEVWGGDDVIWGSSVSGGGNDVAEEQVSGGWGWVTAPKCLRIGGWGV